MQLQHPKDKITMQVFNKDGSKFIQFDVVKNIAKGTLWNTEDAEPYKDFTTAVKQDDNGKFVVVSVGGSGRKIRFRLT
jgi:hypothetical protein